ncbi:MAG: ABC transporter ATP-binding protein [Puniceicoccales bacterium]|nr:ABC transporter ATP-binding protein [Puniceicoccales bacterium]
MSALSAEGLKKSYNGTAVFADVGIHVAPGELFFVLGPSGCGKTTLLRVLAGSLVPDAGTVRVGKEDVSTLPAHLRKVSLVSRNNALWPHLNVRGNVAFALEQRRMAAEKVTGAVHDTLAAFALDKLAERLPDTLSGGEQQRVALARALAPAPEVLLLDEPFGLLDAPARRRLWEAVRTHCREHGTAAVCATQHKDDALALAERVAVLAGGGFQQVAPPLEIYRRPRTRFTGEFLSNANVLRGTVLHAGAGEFIATTPIGEVRGALADATATPPPNALLDVLIRPESLHIDAMAPEENAFAGKIEGGSFEGTCGHLLFRTSAGAVLKIAELNPQTGGGSTAGNGATFAWVLPEDVTGILRKS